MGQWRWHITWYNRRWYEYTGTTPEQMEGWGWQRVHDPQALPAVLERWKASIATGEPFEMTFPLRGADGNFRRFLTRIQPLKDAQGRVVQWFGTNTDVEELKRTEQALREAEQRLRFALETTHTGAWDLDLVDHTAFRSLEHDRVFGYPEPLPEWTYEMFLQHVLPEDRAAVDAKFRQATVTQGLWDFECRIRRADGEVRWILAAGRHRADAAGGKRRMAGVVQDITERKRAEERIQASLREKEVMLKEIHHRVKNNLQVIASLVDMQTNALDKSLSGVFQDVRDRVRTMAMVHEKLYQSESLARVDFADYARSLVNYLARAHGNSDTTVGLKLDLQPVSLSVESAVPCGLMLNELVTNAYKHVFRGRAEGEVALALRKGPDGRVSLEVSDNGAGLPAGMDWRQSRSLGLQLIDLLAGQLNAAVDVSTAGGTHFRLPLNRRNRNNPEKETMSKATILIVEDEAIVARDLSQKLERLGYEVRGVTARGEEAVALARERRPDLVLMDIRLQGPMDGVETANHIREECALPVIFLTAHSDQSTVQRAKLSEPFGYLLKPFEERDLETQIEIAFYKHQTEQEVHRQREWLRVTLQSIGDAVITTDVAGKVTSLNPVAEELTGWKMAEALNRPLGEVFDIINEETRKPAFNPVERVLREGKVIGLANHTALIARDGKERAIEDSAAPIIDSQGRILGVVMVFHDVTQKRRTEEELRKAKDELAQANANLEQLVQERTAKLQETVAELENFSYTITHDMRAPLRAMSGYGQMLLEESESLGSTSKEFIERINIAVQRMDQLILDSLDYNKLVRHQFDLTPIDCEALLRGMIESYPQYHASKAHISIEGNIPAVLGNGAGLTQCFSNLLNNAIKFVRPGETPVIQILAEDKGDQVRIWFQDNGIGIREDCHEKIFLAFQRLDVSYEGTGIGLALVRKAAQRMGGAVGVESEPGKGSCFWLEFKKPHPTTTSENSTVKA